ncbi:EAL domain-containing protein [Methylobacterium sp. JK268]
MILDDRASLGVDWLWETDASLRLTRLEGRFAALTGVVAAARIGSAFPGLDGDGGEDPRGALRTGRPFRDLLASHRHPDGGTRWLRFAGAPVRTPEGAVLGYRGVAAAVPAGGRPEAPRGREPGAPGLDAVLAHAGQGLVLLGADLRVAAVNQRLRDLYDLPPGAAEVGLSAADLARACAARLAGPGAEDEVSDEMAALVGRRALRSERRLANGRTVAMTLTPTPEGGAIAVHEDATARVLADARLAEQNLRLDAALKHMSHGLVLFDAGHRVTVLNQQFLDLYGLSAEEARPGITAEHLIALRAAAGNFPGREAAAVWAQVSQRLATRTRYRLDERLSDGRTVAVTCAPTPEGGFVTVHEDVSAAKIAEARIVHMARHDALTGLPNRVQLQEALNEALAQAPAAGPAAVFCLDLDRFKAVNDALGHAAGDLLLRQVTARLGAAMRRRAAGGTALLARLGGDEFALVLQPADRASAADLAEALIAAVGRDFDLDGKRANVGLSIGIALDAGTGAGPEDLLRSADMALYSAKGEGRGVHRFFEPGMDAALQERRAVELALRAALAPPQFELHFQPVVTLATGAVAGFEALVRWRHPDRGLVPPGAFIRVAEETGLILPLGEWVLREACRAAASWPAPLRVAVNLSPVQVRDAGLARTVEAILDEAGLDAARLELEITEGALLQEGETALAVLHRLRQRGVRVAMDDFGTGFSSLKSLRAFPFDRIKVDRSFVADLTVRPDAAAIVRAVAGLGADLGIATTAEGVETRDQLALLREAGCTEVQGFLTGRPVGRDGVAALLAGDLRRVAPLPRAASALPSRARP